MNKVSVKTNISAKIIADSISAVNGKRITTYELEYPRFIHSEFMTHRMISKNAASSRAIPVKAMLMNILANPAMPSHWGKNQAGMQANEECNNLVEDCGDFFSREAVWQLAMNQALDFAEAFAEAGYHKQIVNRLTEPFQMIKVVATATEWDNFFWLRKHADAQPEIRILAEKMWEAREASTPEVLLPGEWHTPYVEHCVSYDNTGRTQDYYIGEPGTDSFKMITLEEALKVSSSMCAQVSYRKADDTLEKALMVYDRLVESKPVHASPFEHQATPMGDPRNWGDAYERITMADWPDGVTGQHYKLGYTSGNFAGWIQHRQLIEDNTCWEYKE